MARRAEALLEYVCFDPLGGTVLKRPYLLGLEPRERTVHVHEQTAKLRPHEPAAPLVERWSCITEAHRLRVVLPDDIDGIDEVIEFGTSLLADKSDVMTLPDQFTDHLARVYPAP